MIRRINRLSFLLLALWLAGALALPAQVVDADRHHFEEVKARADKGEAAAQLELGALYAVGSGVPQDAAKAARWHRKAADQGLARAQYQLALDYAAGSGVKANRSEAAKWFRKAADQHLAEAQLNLGLCYANGEGVAESASEAARWFRAAADQGLAGGQYELGRSYLDGTGVSKDISEGVKWVRLAANQGFALAENRLGQCYTQAVGVPKDLVEAYKWFNLAAAQDDELATEIRVSLAKLENLLTQEQVAQAQTLARAFKPAPSTPPGDAGTEHTPTAAKSSDTGTVNVKADDDSCEIFADGRFVGNSPAKLKLSPGPHVVEVRKSGFRTFRREIDVGAGADLNLRAKLERQE